MPKKSKHKPALSEPGLFTELTNDVELVLRRYNMPINEIPAAMIGVMGAIMSRRTTLNRTQIIDQLAIQMASMQKIVHQQEGQRNS